MIKFVLQRTRSTRFSAEYQRLFWFIGLILNFLPVLQASTAFNLEGDIRYSGTLSNRISRSFHIVNSADGAWSITTWAEGEPRRSSAIYDKTNIYRVTDFGNGSFDKRMRLNGSTIQVVPLEPENRMFAKNKGALTVIPGAIPDYDSSLIAPLWTAFCSGAVLGAMGEEGDLKPVWVEPGTSNAVHAIWERNEQKPYFPSKMFFLRTNGTYKALLESFDFQSTQELNFPSYVKLTQFSGRSQGTNVSELIPFAVTEAWVISFSQRAEAVALVIPSNSVVTDQRLPIGSSNATSDFFAYRTTNGSLMEPEKIKKSDQYLREQIRRSVKKEGNSMRRLFVLALLGCVIFSLLMFQLYKYIKLKTKNESENSN